jgi:hypothetical protein
MGWVIERERRSRGGGGQADKPPRFGGHVPGLVEDRGLNHEVQSPSLEVGQRTQGLDIQRTPFASPPSCERNKIFPGSVNQFISHMLGISVEKMKVFSMALAIPFKSG